MNNLLCNRSLLSVGLSGLAVLSPLGVRAALTDGLVAYFPLDDASGTTATETVNSNHGTLSGNFTGTEWTTGRVGGGLQFTRTATSGAFPGTHAGFIEADELLKTVNPATGVLEDGVAYTFNAWVRWAPWGASPSFGYAIWGANTAVNQNGNVIRLGLDNDADGFTARAVNGLTADGAGVAADFTDEGWHMVTAVFEAGGNADIYFDGQLSVSTTSDTGNEREKAWSVANLFHFGMEMEGNATTDPFSGTLDELAMWNRNLTQAEITELYNGGAGVAIGTPATGPAMGAPSSSNPTNDGATVECQLLQDDADDVTLVWAYTDQGETTVGTWTGAAGGGSHSFGAATQNDILNRVLTGLDGDTQYFFRFLATKAPDSDWSAAGSFVTGVGGSPSPADFGGIAGTGLVATKVDLSWTDGYANETGYVIQRSTDPAFGTVDEFLVGANESSFTDDTTDPNTTYYYRIAAQGSSGTGTFSAGLEVTTGSNPVLSGNLTEGLVAYFPLNESSGTTAAELVAGNDGTLMGNFTGAEWTAGKLGGGLEFTRTGNPGPFPGTHAGFIEADELLKTVNPGTGVLEDGVAYTFAAWVKWAPQAGGGVNFGYAIWGANTAVNENGNVVRLGLDNNADGFTARAINGLPVDAGGVTADFSDEEWHLVTAVFDAGGNANLYFDGQLSVSRTSDGGNERERLWSVANLFHFGMEMEGNETTDPFSGTLDELVIWNRELTVAEIALLYNDGDGVVIGSAATGPRLTIESMGSDLIFTWDSQAGKVYDLLSSADPEADGDPSTWPVVSGQEGLAATPPVNTRTISRPADAKRLYVVRERNAPPPPPVFFDDFETVPNPDWTTGANGGDAGTTAWERGAPINVGPFSGYDGSATCFGTNISANHTLNTDIWLRSPSIDLTGGGITGATLSFFQHRDTDLDTQTDDDYGTIRVLKASDLTQLGDIIVTDVEGFDFDGENNPIWVDFQATPLPAEAIGEEIILEFRFKSDDAAAVFAGWYIDNVMVEVE